MQGSSYIVAGAPLKYGGQQENYQQRMQAIISWGARQIKETPKNEGAIVELFFRLLERFMEERQRIARDHHTLRAEQFGRRRDADVGTKDFYQTILDDVYQEYNGRVLNILAEHLRGMSLESKQTSQKKKKIEEVYLGRRSSFEIEILEQEDLIQSNWIRGVNAAELPPGFPLELMEKRETQGLTAAEWAIWKQELKKLKEERPGLYKHMKMTTCLLDLQKNFPTPEKVPLSGGKVQLIGNEGNLKSFFALTTVRLEVKGNNYAITQYLTWLYRDFVTHPVDRMLKHSKVMVLHQDNFLINDTLQEIALIFAQAVLTHHEKQNELEENTGVLRHYFANNMPCERGSASIGEMYEGSIYGARDLEVHYNPNKQIDLESLTSPLLSLFMKNYKSTRELKPVT